MNELKLPPTLKEALANIYGEENTVENMRQTGITESGWHSYVWVKADEFATAWLRNNGYYVTETEIMDDCIGYSCHRKGIDYAVFFYAYGEKRTAQLDGDYCQPLCDTRIAKGKNVIIVYINVKKHCNENGETEYEICNYFGENSSIESWLIKTVNGQSVFVYYPRKELVDHLPRLIAAYNTGNLDVLKTICDTQVVLDYDDQLSLNDSFFHALSYVRKNYGKMKLGYIRFNDSVYSSIGIIENYAYVGYSVNNQNNKIDRVTFYPLDNPHEELIVLDDEITKCDYDDVPDLKSISFLPPSEFSRFSIRLVFENGEIRRYDLKVDFEKDEVVEFQHLVMTDKIFRNGKLTDHISKPKWFGYDSYKKRGQGVEFITGAAISKTELYYNSYPIEEFSYKDLDKVYVSQFDYSEDGFAIGHIFDLDPRNPYYLLDKNCMVAKTIPDEYQQTPICVYPPCGGYSSDGLIMVSTMGRIDLKYHHNWRSCAGLWGWLDKEMNVVIEPKYIYAQNFYNGTAIVCKGDLDKKIINGKEQYWCEHEQWGVIDVNENEIVPCVFDEIENIDNTDCLFIVHEGGWDDGHYAVYSTKEKRIIFALDFEYDPGYMFNECFVTENDYLIFDAHNPGKETDIIYIYDLTRKEFVVYGEIVEGCELNGKTRIVVNKDGEDIIVF